MIRVPLATGDLTHDLEATGKLKLSRELEGHLVLDGSARNGNSQYGFQCTRANYAAMRSQLKKGTTVTIFGKQWRIAGLQVTERHRYQNDIFIKIELVSPLAPFDSEIVNQRCYLDAPTDISGMLEKGILTLSSLVTYTGLNPYRIPFGIPDDELRVTPRELLEKYKRRLHADGGFIYWGGTQPEFRAWGRTPVRSLADADFLTLNDETTWDEPGQGAEVNGVQLVKEVVHLEFVPDSEASGEVKYDECKTFVEGEDADTVYPGEYFDDDFRGSSIYFDNGGLTKTRITRHVCNGEKVWERFEKYGFVGNSFGTGNVAGQQGSYQVVASGSSGDGLEYKIVFRSASNFVKWWEKVEDKTEYYRWNEIDNYLDVIDVKGWLLYRGKKESDSVEAINAELKRLKAINEGDTEEAVKQLEIRKLYSIFYKQDIEDATEWETDYLGNRYRDIHPTKTNPYKFAKREQRKSDFLVRKPDPEQEEDSEAIITIGKRYEKDAKVNILAPTSRGDLRPLETYVESLRESNAEGDGLKDRIEVHPEVQKTGRPSEHRRREWYGWGRSAVPAELLVEESDDTLILDSPNTGYTDTDPPLGTWSSPGIVKKSDAKAAMELELSIENTKVCRTTAIKVPATMDWEEGDLLAARGELFVILSIEIEFEIRKTEAIAETMDVKIGKLVAFGSTYVASHAAWQQAYDDYIALYPTSIFPPAPAPATEVPAVEQIEISYNTPPDPSNLAFAGLDVEIAEFVFQPTDSAEIGYEGLGAPLIFYQATDSFNFAFLSRAVIFDYRATATVDLKYRGLGAAISTIPFSATDSVSLAFEGQDTEIGEIVVRAIDSSAIAFGGVGVEISGLTALATNSANLGFEGMGVEVGEIAIRLTGSAGVDFEGLGVEAGAIVFLTTDSGAIGFEGLGVEAGELAALAIGFATIPYEGEGAEVREIVVRATDSCAIAFQGMGAEIA
ncbi:MAG: hypothetical protein J7647_32170 [Cyanobacteria bacterium SBLK]|nr:hypothetical protein [Cyanobacteria bacterium SBLK]